MYGNTGCLREYYVELSVNNPDDFLPEWIFEGQAVKATDGRRQGLVVDVSLEVDYDNNIVQRCSSVRGAEPWHGV